MPTLDTIPGLAPDELELLEAAGWSDLRLLAAAEAARVTVELAKANTVLHLCDEAPVLDRVREWIAAAARMTGVEPAPAAESEAVAPAELPEGPVNFESDPDVQAMIARAPLAIPLENRLLAERGIPPSQIAIAPVLSHADSDLDVRVGTGASKREVKRERAPATAPRVVASGASNGAESRQAAKQGIDTSRVRSIEEMRDGPVAPLEKPRASADDRINLLCTPREATNRGRNPNSKWYIRGVLHDRPVKVWLGSLIVALFQVTFPLGLVSAPLLILSNQKPETFGWVPGWVIAFPIAVPVLGLLYLMVSTGVKCRVCGQKVLVPRHCLKNSKAHHVPLLGYILPTAVHTMIFRWFNCTFCGTSVRIKE